VLFLNNNASVSYQSLPIRRLYRPEGRLGRNYTRMNSAPLIKCTLVKKSQTRPINRLRLYILSRSSFDQSGGPLRCFAQSTRISHTRTEGGCYV